MTAHINIGSNLGHRAELISRAVTLVEENVGKVTAISRPIETRAEGYDSPNLFLNVGVNAETALSPLEIVERLQLIEHTIDPEGSHRNARGGYCDRKIDLDLIALDTLISTDPAAIVPHPRMAERRFVIRPLSEIWPEWQHPQLKQTSVEILQKIKSIAKQ